MKRPFYIDYPQEHFEGQAHRYRCALCKVETTKINGHLEGHKPDCMYRQAMVHAGFEMEDGVGATFLNTSDEED